MSFMVGMKNLHLWRNIVVLKICTVFRACLKSELAQRSFIGERIMEHMGYSLIQVLHSHTFQEISIKNSRNTWTICASTVRNAPLLEVRTQCAINSKPNRNRYWKQQVIFSLPFSSNLIGRTLPGQQPSICWSGVKKTLKYAWVFFLLIVFSWVLTGCTIETLSSI